MTGLRHLQRHFYFKRAVALGFGCTAKHLRPIVVVAQYGCIPVSAIRPPPESRTTLYRITYLGALNRYTGIAHCHTLYLQGIACSIGFFHLREVYVECGSLVFLYPDAMTLLIGLDGKSTRQSLGRQGKVCCTYAVGIGQDLLLGYDLVVGIA